MSESTHLPTATTTSPSLRKAAVLISSLPLEDMAHLTQSLTSEQLERLADAIAVLHLVKPKEQRLVARELGCLRRSSPPAAESPPQIETKSRLGAADPAIVANVLSEEVPQTIAAVLSQMEPSAAAAVLQCLSTDRQLFVVKRVAAIQKPDIALGVDLMRSVSDIVEKRSRPLQVAAGGETFLAHVIHCTDRATEKALLENLSEEDRPLVDRLLQRIYLMKDSRRPRHADPVEETRRSA